MMNKKGFTLIELLIVITIIGVLVAIAIPRLIEYSEKNGGIVEATKEIGKLKGNISIQIGTNEKEDAYVEDISVSKGSKPNAVFLDTLECDNLSTVMQNCQYNLKYTNDEIWFIPLTCIKGVQGWECAMK